MGGNKRQLSKEKAKSIINAVRTRFMENMGRHKEIGWDEVEKRLKEHPDKLWSLHEMELTDGEPDVVGMNEETGEIMFFDCSAESPEGRRSLCYDREALESRKKNKPDNSAMDMAEAMEIEILTEDEYKFLQYFGPFDRKTSSWLRTPSDVRELGGAIFGDHRFGRSFIYHNGAESYYAARGFRGKLKV